jgi:hypothetical protein
MIPCGRKFETVAYKGSTLRETGQHDVFQLWECDVSCHLANIYMRRRGTVPLSLTGLPCTLPRSTRWSVQLFGYGRVGKDLRVSKSSSFDNRLEIITHVSTMRPVPSLGMISAMKATWESRKSRR